MELKDGYKKTEIGIIPQDWECINLEDKSKFENGKAHENEIGVNGKYVVVNSKFISTEGKIKKYSNKGIILASMNDILIVMSDLPNGRAIAKCFYVDEENKYTVNQRVGKITPVSINPKFLFYKVNRNAFYLSFDDGVKQTNLRKHDVLGLKIAMPISEVEQQEIATALSDIDSFIKSLTKLVNKKKNIKQGAMQELLTGRKRLEGFSDKWNYKTLGDVCKIYRGGSPRPIQAFLTSSSDGVNWIKIGDVEASAKYINSTKEKIISKGAGFSREVYKGDLILSNSMSFGRPYILNIDGCIHDGWLVIQNYQATFTIHFLYYLLCSNETMSQYIAMASGSGVQNLSKDKVACINVPVISIDEQIAIANILADMDTEIEQLEIKLNKYKDIKQGMMQELLTGKIRLLEEVVQ